MGKLQAAYWLLVAVPWVVSLVARMALRIWAKNVRPHINKQAQPNPPVCPSDLMDRKGNQRASLGQL